MAGEVRAVCDPDNQRAEFAIQVAGAWQGKGLGGLLMRKLLDWLRQFRQQCVRQRRLHMLLGGQCIHHNRFRRHLHAQQAAHQPHRCALQQHRDQHDEEHNVENRAGDGHAGAA